MLILCRECERDVSTKAKTCSHCGAPVEQANRITTRKKLEIGAVLLFMFLLVAISFRFPSSSRVPSTPESGGGKTVLNLEPKARDTENTISKRKKQQSRPRPESTP